MQRRVQQDSTSKRREGTGTNPSDGSKKSGRHYLSSFSTKAAALEKIAFKKMATES